MIVPNPAGGARIYARHSLPSRPMRSSSCSWQRCDFHLSSLKSTMVYVMKCSMHVARRQSKSIQNSIPVSGFHRIMNNFLTRMVSKWFHDDLDEINKPVLFRNRYLTPACLTVPIVNLFACQHETFSVSVLTCIRPYHPPGVSMGFAISLYLLGRSAARSKRL